jgi:putative transcriptional regulator
MGERRIGVTDLSRLTGLSYSTCYALYADRTRRIDFATLEALCRLFECRVGDVLEYVPQAEPETEDRDSSVAGPGE